MHKISRSETVVFSLLFFIAAMLAARVLYMNSIHYLFLLWNLFLAWIPFELSLRLRPRRNKIAGYVITVVWLLFFPNALYIVTDLMHLGDGYSKAPVWFDTILLFTSSVTGLVMAFLSLHYVEQFLRRQCALQYVNTTVVFVLFLGPFGVYLGRFLRWNSWDIVTNPVSLLTEIGIRIFNPVDYYKTWLITLLFTFFFSILYFGIKPLPVVLLQKKSPVPNGNRR